MGSLLLQAASPLQAVDVEFPGWTRRDLGCGATRSEKLQMGQQVPENSGIVDGSPSASPLTAQHGAVEHTVAKSSVLCCHCLFYLFPAFLPNGHPKAAQWLFLVATQWTSKEPPMPVIPGHFWLVGQVTRVSRLPCLVSCKEPWLRVREPLPSALP